MTWTLSKAHMDADHREAQRQERIWRELTGMDLGETRTIAGEQVTRHHYSTAFWFIDAGEWYVQTLTKPEIRRYLNDKAREQEEHNTMTDAQKHREHEGFVSYYDAGAGVFLAWNSGATLGMLADPGHIHIISQDNRRTLGEIPTDAQTVEQAGNAIRAAINTPGKPYGMTAGLWQ